MLNFIKNNKREIAFCLILLGFILSLTKVKNYGISYDELEYRQQGFIALNSIVEKIAPVITYKIKQERELVYPSLEDYMGKMKNNFKIQHTIFAGIEYLFLKNSEKQKVYLMRHYLNLFMSFLMIICFYKLLSLNFNKNISYLGTLFFFLNPKIYPDFIYNPNDIWFMFFLILSLYSATYFFKKNKIKYFYLLPLFVSLSINVRMIGIYIYLIFLLLFFLNFIFDKNKKNLKFISQTSLQILILIISLYILTPQVWTDPIFKFAELFYGQLTNSDINPKILFMGHMKDSADLNSYYLILWIAISTPVMTLILFLMGLTLIFLKLFKLLSVKKTNPSLILILLYLFLPLFAVLAFQPNIFNGWRHFYFLYPGIVFIATYAINFILEESNLKLLKKIFTFFIIFNFLYLCHWSIKNHPYEYVFLNFLSKKFANKFEGDYWGLSDFQSIKYILNNDQRKNIKITGLNGDRIDFTVNILENKLKNRVEIKYPISKGLLNNGINLNKKDLKEVDYFITRLNQKYNINYYLKNGFKKFQTISVNNRIISATFTQEN